MVLFRLFAWILVAFGIALLGADAVSSLEKGEPVIRTTAEIFEFGGIDLISLTSSAPEGVETALGTVLRLPFWSVVGLIGIVLTLIFRPLD
ncbi:MAG: hypothetical protein AAF720_07790 [Pseudomonadota bacterium]